EAVVGMGEPSAGGDERTQLFAAVYASPDDDGPRAVLADWLLERNDPRGELIAMQLARYRDDPTREPTPKERAMIRQAGRTVFDGLDDDGAFAIQLERGFPIAANVRSDRMTVPAWATVESLFVTRPNIEFRGAPVLRGLRRLHNLSSKWLRTIELPRELDALW